MLLLGRGEVAEEVALLLRERDAAEEGDAVLGDSTGAAGSSGCCRRGSSTVDDGRYVNVPV